MTPEPARTPLAAERFRRLEEIFHAAIDLPAGDRTGFVRGRCLGDAALFTEIQGILAGFDAGRTTVPSPAPPPEASRAGALFGEYCIEQELAQGGMGTVYLAHRADGHYEQRVALKVVSGHLRSQFFTARFRTERQILAQLNHPNITRLLDGGISTDGEPYLVMEYVDGSPLNRYCDSLRLPIAGRIRLFVRICAAVEHAHRNLIVHRDLKPGNIFVTADGIPKLLDFGTAKLLSDDGRDSMTMGLGMLTPRYASPEQLRGEPVTTLTDVFSLGVMLYELLTGAWPFGDPKSPVTGLERAVRDVEPARPGSVVTDESAQLRSESRARLARVVDGDLRSVLAKAIALDPRSRYRSVEQLSEDLSRYLEGQPVYARAQTLLYRGSRFAHRNRWRLAVGFVLVAGLCGAAFSALQQYGRNQQRMLQVRDLSESYLTDILNEVGKLPGSMAARLLIVDRARRNLDQLSRDAPGDPELRRELAGAYLKLADIQGKPFTVSLGDAAGALLSYRKAEALAARGSSKDWDSLAVMVRARRTIAQIDARTGNYSEAFTVIDSSLAPAERLAKEAPASLQVDGEPAAALVVEANWTLGYVMMKQVAANPASVLQDHERVAAQLRKALQMAERLHATHAGTDALTGKCSMYLGFALEGLAEKTGDIQYSRQSAEAHRHATELVCKVAAADPNPRTVRDCADAYGELSWALYNTGDGEAAVVAAREFVSRMDPIAGAEPLSVEARRDMANAYFHLGAAENAAGRFPDALGHLQAAESRLPPPAEISTDDAFDSMKLFAQIRIQAGRALVGLHRPAAAVDTLQKAVDATRGRAVPAQVLISLESQLDQARKMK
jgi:non-specific serine/threonine protein kinase/serine/threonine-protein kinase